jgi:N-acetyl sugar amidotransferase
MKYCRRCILPDTRPNLRLDADGVCNACRTHAARPRVDWAARRADFARVVEHARSKNAGYDCVIPVSGGKDSTWQVVTCLEAGLKPLTVTWRTPGRTAIGQANLDNLVKLGVDHIDYSINPKLEARFMLKAFERFGSTAIPMHLALFNIPLAIALRFRIPLVVWGENSAVEYGSAASAHEGHKLDAAWLATYGVTHGTTARDWIGPDLSEKDLAAYFGPNPDELESLGVRAVFLGHYFQWDPATTYAVAKQHGFRENPGGARTGLYDYADIDDDFISLHHWMKWYKFGFTRLFDNLSLEIRNGRLDRGAAVAVVAKAGDQTPCGDIDKFSAFCGISPQRFFDAAENFRNPQIWQRSGGVWRIPGFLVADWKWQ